MRNVDNIRNQIKTKRASLLVCSKKNSNKLLSNLTSLDIGVCYDGIQMAAGWLNRYFRCKFAHSRVVGVLLDGYGVEQKHLGEIPSILNKNGINVIYLINPMQEWYDKIKPKYLDLGRDLICVTDEILELLSFYPFLIFQQERLRGFNPKVTTLKLFVTAEQMWNQAIFPMKDYEGYEKAGNVLSNYINVHGESLYRALLKKKIGYNAETSMSMGEFIKGGYPSIDRQILEFKENNNVKRDTIVFISSTSWYNNGMQEYVRSIILKLINSYRILFKSHPVYKAREGIDEEKEFISCFFGHQNFVYYQQSKLHSDELNRSIVCVTTSSSLGYSYPAISKRPAILLYPSRNKNRDFYYNDRIHIRLYKDSSDDIVQVVKSLASDKRLQKVWRDKILDYCRNDLYNYGCSSKYIADFILKWFKNREILKELD